MAADNPVSVAYVASFLSLVGPSRETAKLATDKLLMKSVFSRNGVSIPWFRAVQSPAEIKSILEERGDTYVLKPTDSRGSRGVVRVSKSSDVDYAWEFSRPYSVSGGMILEEWLEGPQLSTESLVWQGRSYLCGVADRNYNRLDSLFPHVVEDGGETPSRFSPEIDSSLDELITKAARAIGLENGTIKGDIVLTEKGPVVIEVAARLSGGYFATDTIPLVYDYPIVKEAIKIVLGETPVLPNKPLQNRVFQANRFLFLAPGKVKSITGPSTEDPDIAIFKIYVREGQIIPETTNHTQRGGMVLCEIGRASCRERV